MPLALVELPRLKTPKKIQNSPAPITLAHDSNKSALGQRGHMTLPTGRQEIGKQRKSPRIRMTRLMLERMQQIHTEIYEKKYPSAAKLARDFKVCSRTVRRDIEMMVERMNLPIKYSYKQHGYFFDGEVSPFPDIFLSEAELISLIIAGNSLQSNLFAGMGQQVLSLFDKLADGLPDRIWMNLADWQTAISFHYIGEPKFKPEIFHGVVAAIAKKQQIRILYETPNCLPGERVIEPYKFAFINGEWVCFAFDYKNNELRRFVPQRMHSVAETGKTFERPKDFRVEDFLDDAFGPYCSDVLYDVTVKLNKKIAHEGRERSWPRSHRLEPQPDGSVLLHMKLTHMHDIHCFLMRFSGEAVPLQPAELCKLYDDSIAKMHASRLETSSISALPYTPTITAPGSVENREGNVLTTDGLG